MMLMTPKNGTVQHRRRSGCMNYSCQWREKCSHIVRLTRWVRDGKNLTVYRATERVQEQEDKWTGFRGSEAK